MAGGWIADAIGQAPERFDAGLPDGGRTCTCLRCSEFRAQSARSVDPRSRTGRRTRQPPGGSRRARPAEPAGQRGRRRLPDRLLLVPVLRLRRVPARLLIPPPAAGRLHPRRGGHAPRWRLTSSGRGSSASPSSVRARSSTTRVPATKSSALPCRPPSQAQDGMVTTTARRCADCGYLHPEAVGHRHLRELRWAATRHDPLAPAAHLGTHRQRGTGSPPTKRSADAPGFELQTSYRFGQHGGEPGRIDAAASDAAGLMLNLRLWRLGHRPGHECRTQPAPEPGLARLHDRRHHRPVAQGDRAGGPCRAGGRRPGGSIRRQAQAACHPLCRGPPQHPRLPLGRGRRTRDRGHAHDRAGARHRGGVPA